MAITFVVVSGCGHASIDVSSSDTGVGPSVTSVPGDSTASTPGRAAELGARLGRCTDSPGESIGAQNILKIPTDWARVVHLGDSARAALQAAPVTTSTVDMDIAVRAGSAEAAVTTRSLAVHGTILNGIVWALDHGVRDVFIGYFTIDNGSDKGVTEVVLALVKVADGYFVPGDCEDRVVRVPLETTYGSRLTELLDELVGSSHDQVPALLARFDALVAPPTSATIAQQPALDPPQGGDGLAAVTVSLEWPTSWAGRDQLLCTEVRGRGVNPCASLFSLPAGQSYTLEALVDSTLELEVVLVPDNGTTNPSAVLGTVKVALDRTTQIDVVESDTGVITVHAT